MRLYFLFMGAIEAFKTRKKGKQLILVINPFNQLNHGKETPSTSERKLTCR